VKDMLYVRASNKDQGKSKVQRNSEG